MTQLVTVAAGMTGLLLVVEDIHDADDGSLQLLTYLGEMAGQERVLVVLSHRSEATSRALPAPFPAARETGHGRHPVGRPLT